MKRLSSPSAVASGTRALFGFVSLAACLTVPFFIGCQGSLEGGSFPSMGGTGGSGTGSGGSTSGSGGSGSGGSTSGSGGSSGTACDAPGTIFKAAAPAGCTAIGCHASGAGSNAPDLANPNPSVLKSMNAMILCPNMKMVDTATPKNSVLYRVVVDDQCTVQMPLGGPTLEQKDLDCLADWISKL